MKRIRIGVLVAGLMLGACRKERSGGQAVAVMNDMKDSTDTTGKQGMPGMPGMAAPAGALSGVPIERGEAARLGITFARAAERPVHPFVRAVGVLKYADPRRVYVSARVSGWVEKLYADYTGRRVSAGEQLLALYSPELVSAQEEFLLAKRLKDDTLAMSARRRLALWDIPADQIDSLDARGEVTRTLLLRAPRSGEIVEKDVIEGQAVQAGQNLFLIADRAVLWADLAIFEQHRRRGYASEALRLLEEKVREQGLDTISLHVFGHNHAARELYEKSGYAVTNVNMSKKIA